jgi:hypothetical protein
VVRSKPDCPAGAGGQHNSLGLWLQDIGGLTRLESPEAVDTAIYGCGGETFGLAFLDGRSKNRI